MDAPITQLAWQSGHAQTPPHRPHPEGAYASSLMTAHRGIVYRLASSIATRYSLSTFFRSLVNFGHEGLEDAVMRYDPQRSVRFATFAWHRVRGAIIDGARRMGWLTRNIEAGDTPEPTAQPALPRGCSASDHKPWRRERGALDEGSITLPSSLEQRDERSPEALLEKAERAHLVRHAVGTLSEPQRTLIRRSYLHEEKLETVASELGLSRSWACRMRYKALETLAGRLQELAPDMG